MFDVLICCLLEAGANLNIPEILYGNTALWRAVFNVDDTGTGVEQMLAYGGDPTIANKNGKTPLDVAYSIGTKSLLLRTHWSAAQNPTPSTAVCSV